MSTWRPWLMQRSRLKYLAIVEAIEADIRAGRLRAGERLPPQRTIADTLGVDLTTVTRALNEARKRGLIEARVGRGTFVRGNLAANPKTSIDAPPVIDLSMNSPPQPAAARLQQLIPETIQSLLANERGMLHLHYQESAGSQPDRAAAAIWLSKRIADLKESHVLMTSGAQNALCAVIECLMKPGDVIAAGALTYPGIKAIAQLKALTIKPLAVDRHGILPEAFEQCCRTFAPKVVYIVPAIDNPTAATLPESRRREIALTARKYSVAIIEDDPYSPLQDSPIVSFANLAPTLTWHIATLSKCATPALRIAYVVVPNNVQGRRLAGVLRAANLMAPPLNAALASRWITSGTLDKITTAIREENIERQKIARSVLASQNIATDPNGHHIWIHLPAHWRAADFVEHAEKSGISVVASSAFATTDDAPDAVRISLGVAPNRKMLTDALEVLESLFDQSELTPHIIV